MKSFGHRLRELRKANKLTQKQLGNLIGVRDSIISFYELGDRIPSPDVLVKLARVFHVSTDFLLGLENNEFLELSGLQEKDKQVLIALADLLREKNQR